MDNLMTDEQEVKTSAKRGGTKRMALLIEEGTEITQEILNALRADFFAKLGESGGMVFEISEYELHDRKDHKIKVAGHLGYSLLEVPVTGIEIKIHGSKPFAIVNEGVHIPLFKTSFGGSKENKWVLYSKDEAIEKWTNLMEISAAKVVSDRERAQEAVEDLIAAEDYVKNAIKKHIW